MNIRALIAVAALALASLQAQQTSSAKPGAKPEAATPESAKETTSAGAYKFEYTLTELSGKQKINERKFEMLTSDRGSVQSNSRVPVQTGGGGGTQFSYVELGLNASMHFVKMNEVLQLNVEVSMNFLVPPPAPAVAPTGGPETRSIRMQIGTEIKPGVPTTIGTVEDVASTHAYALSVTAVPR